MFENLPFIFTFYSYKGGVGRSMAVLNTAYSLAGKGRHVLIVDMDLEAPGISGFLQRHKELDHTPDQDVVSLLSKIMAYTKDGGRPDGALDALGPLSKFTARVKPSKHKQLVPPVGLPGRIDVLAANEADPTYWGRMSKLHLEGASKEQLLKWGLIFRQYLKDYRFTHQPPGYKELRRKKYSPYDYVLIDSRTGITETGGFCVGPLSDRLVVVTGLNDQNVEGTLKMLTLVGVSPQRFVSKEEKAWDEAVPAEDNDLPAMIGPKPTLIVASPVPSGEIEYKRRRVKEVEEKLGLVGARLSYHPQMALLESVFVRDYPEEYLAKEYMALTDRLMASVSDDNDQIFRTVKETVGQFARKSTNGHPDVESHVKILKLLLRVAQAAKNNIRIQVPGPLIKHFLNSPENINVVSETYASLSQEKVAREENLWTWGHVLLLIAKNERGAERDRLFKLSDEMLSLAYSMSKGVESLLKWVDMYLERAALERGASAMSLYHAAIEKLEAAIKAFPDEEPRLFCKIAEILLNETKYDSPDIPKPRLSKVKSAYSKALKAGIPDAVKMVGMSMSSQAVGTPFEAALHPEAISYLSQYTDENDEDHEALAQLGHSYARLAHLKSNRSSKGLYTKSEEAFERAMKLNPDKTMMALWSAALKLQAEHSEGDDAAELIKRANKLDQIVNVMNGMTHQEVINQMKALGIT